MWDPPRPGLKPASPALQADSQPLRHQGSPHVLFRLPLPPPWGAKGEIVGSSGEKIKAHRKVKGHGLREQGECTLVGTTRSKFTENESFVHWCIASTRRHSNICWIRWTELLNIQLEYLYFIMVPFNMNYLKTLKPSTDTVGRPSSEKRLSEYHYS